MSGAPRARVILLACGSYNPITNMHLRMFELAKDALQKTGRYNVVGGIVSPVNDAYVKKDLVSANHRAAMMRLALKSSEWIRLDTWETEQESWLETVRVLQHHKNCLDSMYNANPLPDTPTKKRKLDQNSSPGSVDQADYAIPSQYHNQNQNEAPVQLKLLCGADLLESFAVPGLWRDEDVEDIVSKYGVVCISRSGTNAEKFIYESDLLTKHQNDIHLVTEWIYNDISATKIRRALRRGQSVKYLLQDSVIDYIKAHNLYGASDK